MNKTKEKLVKDIFDVSKIHHNIYISWNKMPDYEEKDGFNWQDEAGFMMDDFISNFEWEKMNDSGNRNLCACENKTKDSICKKHDLYHIYSAGRSGASLYWDKYWNESNGRGLYFTIDEDELKEKSVYELKIILKEIEYFNKLVKQLMLDFYSQCEYRLKEIREEKATEEKEEKEYQNLKKQVIEKSAIKRLITEIL